jgi:sulfatase maturation enzyme AslB (radical SAM superfamily)
MTSLAQRRSPLADPHHQIDLLAALDLSHLPQQGNFATTLAQAGTQPGLHPLCAAPLEIFQINIGKLCNMTCRHCHVDAGPDRKEIMDRDTIDACLRALDQTEAHTVDITGGAPELNPHFRYLVEQTYRHGSQNGG